MQTPDTRTLFSLDDGEGSRVAATRIVETGGYERQCSRVLEALKLHQGTRGITSADLAAASGLDRFEVARRLPDLRHANMVEVVGSGARAQKLWKVKS